MRVPRMLLQSFLLVLPVAAVASDLAVETAAARAQTQQLVQELGAALKKELATGGPSSAIAVCKQVAPDLAGRMSRDSGSRVTRVSLRVRNPLLGRPDVWEQTVLTDFDQRVAAGEKPETLEAAAIVDEPDGRYFRYLKAIPVQPPCLLCHGSKDAIAPDVAARLDADYPHDRATGYAPGQIRGGVSVKKPLK